MNFTSIGRSHVLYRSRAHTHDEWEVVLNLEGEGTTQIGDRTFSFRAGTVICVPPGQAHAKESKTGFRDTFILFPVLPLPLERPFCLQDGDGRIEQILTMLHGVYHKKEQNYQRIAEGLAEALVQMLLGSLQSEDKDPRVSHLIDKMVENFADPDFSVSDLMAKSGYCEDHIRRVFRRETGESPLEYLTSLRVDCAQRLMRENGRLHYSVAMIGSMAGFADIGYFSRVFKKRTGLSPREYLRQSGGTGND